MSRLLLMTLALFAGTAWSLDGSYGGSWWNPERGGEGIFFEIVAAGEAPLIVAYYFTYDDAGNQAFLVGQGNAEGNSVVLETVNTRGGVFGAPFPEAGVAFEPWGTMTATFESCHRLILEYDGANGAGSLSLERFKTGPRAVAGDCATGAQPALGVSAVDGAYYGAWWDPVRSGEGMFLEVWEDAEGLPQLFAAWFTYAPDDSGEQRWIVGEGPIVGNRSDLAAIVTSGPRFGEAYDPSAVRFDPFGYLSVEFTRCGAARIRYDSSDFGRGELVQEPFLLPMIGAPDCRDEVQDYRDQVIYFALTDRFHNGDPGNDDGTGERAGDPGDRSNPLGWHGGDFAGIVEKIQDGYFSALGVTTLWISPVATQVAAVNVDSGPNRGELFAGYHGYWADDLQGIEPHFGSPEELTNLVSVAHRSGLRVIFDTVVNHAGYGSRILDENPDWLRTGSQCTGSDVSLCLAGLPDFRQELPEVTAFLNDRVGDWMNGFGADGMRMDTMKHVSDSYWRQFFVSGGAGDPARWWTVGEVFSGDPAFVARFQNELKSPSVFDFPLYYAIRDVLAYQQNASRFGYVFSRDDVYEDVTRLTTFVDNHDVPRFVTEAENAGASSAEADERLGVALGLIYFARGIPSIYYGSEIAMRGGGDPYNFELGESNREDMRFDAVRSSDLDERLANLATARREYPVLRFGTQRTLHASGAALAFVREMPRQRPVLVVLNSADGVLDLSGLGGSGVQVAGLFSDGADLIELTGLPQELTVSEGRLIGPLPPRSVRALTISP